MLEQLINLVKEQAGSTIINNPSYSNENERKAVNDGQQLWLVVYKMHWLADNSGDVPYNVGR